MTSAELKYLLAIKELSDKNSGLGVKLTDIALKTGVSKVSVYRAVERLEKSNYITRDDKGKIVLLEYGYKQLSLYMKIILFISEHLLMHCNIQRDIALNDAIGVACALSDDSRNAIITHQSNRK